jgi:hypothetical protein
MANEETKPEPPAAAAAPKKAPEKRTVEAWAEAKKHLPQPFGQARMLARWITGSEVTEKEYDAAVAAVDTIRFG